MEFNNKINVEIVNAYTEISEYYDFQNINTNKIKDFLINFISEKKKINPKVIKVQKCVLKPECYFNYLFRYSYYLR